MSGQLWCHRTDYFAVSWLHGWSTLSMKISFSGKQNLFFPSRALNPSSELVTRLNHSQILSLVLWINWGAVFGWNKKKKNQCMEVKAKNKEISSDCVTAEEVKYSCCESTNDWPERRSDALGKRFWLILQASRFLNKSIIVLAVTPSVSGFLFYIFRNEN